MKILYDHQMFSIQRFGGITKYFCEIISNFPPEYEFELALLTSDNYHLREKKKVFRKINVLPDANFRKKEVLRNLIYKINEGYSRKKISSGRYDVFHPTFYNDYFLGLLKKPYIITVHDLIEFKFANASDQSATVRHQMERTITSADRVISISENTKKDVMETFGIDAAKIDVIYHGYNKPASKPTTNPYGRYILFVGNRGRYKNFKNFVEGAARLFKKDRDLKLVCVGEGFRPDEAADLHRLNMLDRALTMTATESMLNSLYGNALAYVFPSLYEGFGMPILEAFANHCPVCLSSASSFPEVAGEAACYFDPMDPESIGMAIEKVIYDKAFATLLVKAGQERLQHFSWGKAATETIRSYEKLMS